VSINVLTTIIFKELKINASLHTLLQILSVPVVDKSDILNAIHSGGQIKDNEVRP
jgi:hypothetical protein